MPRVNVATEVTGKVLEILKHPGARVASGDEILLVEAMKMEIPVVSPVSGTIVSIDTAPDQTVEQDQNVAIVESDA